MRVRVYSETTVHEGDERYQLAVVESEAGERRLVRVSGERVAIGDWLELAE